MEVERITDIHLLIELRNAFLAELNPVPEQEWPDIKDRLRNYFEKHIPQNDFIALGIRNQDQVISCAFLVIDERPGSLSFPNGLAGTILNVYTYPEHQRKGYGETVMKAIIEEAKKREISVLSLSSTEAGKRLYEKLGFEESHYTEMNFKIR